jgi:hypothetical protein
MLKLIYTALLLKQGVTEQLVPTVSILKPDAVEQLKSIVLFMKPGVTEQLVPTVSLMKLDVVERI